MINFLIAGARLITDEKFVFEKIDEYLQANVLDTSQVRIISGGAKGVDTLARKYAILNDFDFKEYPANWAVNGKGAGFIRNAQMVKVAHKALIICHNDSKGSLHTKKLCEKKGNMDLEVILVEKDLV